MILVEVAGTRWQDLYGWRWRSALGLAGDQRVESDHLALSRMTTDPLLDAAIDVQLAIAADGGVVGAAGGGLMLSAGDEVLVPVRCCSDLELSMSDWVGLLGDEPSDWTYLAAGHDDDPDRETLVRVCGDQVEIVFEETVCTGRRWMRRHRRVRTTPVAIARLPLARALAGARFEQAAFAERVERRLLQRGHGHARVVAQTIAGIAVPELPA
jgi:hypothetical protein